MVVEPYTVAVVPAKMASERFHRKNLANLCGRPLLYYSIEIGKQTPLIGEVYVSSEDDEVLNIAESYGAKAIVRPEHLSQPHITTQEVLSHACNEIRTETDHYPELVVLLQPTHPLRMPEDLDDALRKMNEGTQYDSLFSVVPTDELRGQIVNDAFVPEFPLPRNKRTEPNLYRNTGSFYVFRPDRSFLTTSFFGTRIYPFVLKRSVFEVDIDYPADMELARCLLQTHRAAFSHFKIRSSGDGK
ncbi:MAG: acylneuraminate cytidylyltransferase family protein [Planctomycetota bacterium]|jgi:N-acylneuraminate cytidylyltransferase